MGVTGLLPALKDIQTERHLSSYSGKTIAIDGYAWLHRSVYSCALELSTDKPTTKYLQFFKRRIDLLKQHFKITPYFVFDGDDFDNKAKTEESRKEKRIANKQKGLQLMNRGSVKEAYDYLNKSIDVSPQMAKTIIDYLKNHGIPYIVAPYEADSQMVYLESQGIVDGIMSEDSDLLVFGCQTLLTKFNDKNNTVMEIQRRDFKHSKSFPLASLTQHQLRMVACLSGCDYTKGIPRIGIRKAFQLIQNCSSIDRVLLKLNFDNYKIPPSFELDYTRADLSFQFSRVYDPRSKKVTTLNPLVPETLCKSQLGLVHSCIGAFHEDDIHHKIAVGDIHPTTKELLVSRERALGSQNMKRSVSTPTFSIDSFFSAAAPAKKSVSGENVQRNAVKKKAIENKNSILRSHSAVALGKSRFFASTNVQSVKENKIEKLEESLEEREREEKKKENEKVDMNTKADIENVEIDSGDEIDEDTNKVTLYDSGEELLEEDDKEKKHKQEDKEYYKESSKHELQHKSTNEYSSDGKQERLSDEFEDQAHINIKSDTSISESEVCNISEDGELSEDESFENQSPFKMSLSKFKYDPDNTRKPLQTRNINTISHSRSPNKFKIVKPLRPKTITPEKYTRTTFGLQRFSFSTKK